MNTKKSNKKEKATELYNVLPAVPYQLCPKCGGDGVVLVQNWYGSPTSISSGTHVCDFGALRSGGINSTKVEYEKTV